MSHFDTVILVLVAFNTAFSLLFARRGPRGYTGAMGVMGEPGRCCK